VSLYINLIEINKIACEQVKVSEFIYKLNRVDRIACEQVKISELSVDLIRLTELLVNK